MSCFALVTGGGTAGHVLPALAILDRLAERGHPRHELHYVGAARGIETRLLPPTGYGATFLDVVGIQRSWSARNLAVLPKLVAATVRAWRLLRRLRPRVVVNVGGYASFPATLAARLRRIPIVVVSYDLRPGLVSRLAARFATVTARSFDGGSLPRSVLTGAPVRPELLRVDRSADRDGARLVLGVGSEAFLVGVTGGSQGAGGLNAVVLAAARLAAERGPERSAEHGPVDTAVPSLVIHHVVGERFLGEMSAAASAAGLDAGGSGGRGILYRVIGYEARMAQLYAGCDLMITRAGASTVAELAATGTPAIVVPWPGAAENHQLANAETLGAVGAAIVVEEADLSAERLLEEIDALRATPQRLASIAAAARAEGARHRNDSLVRLVEDTARR